MISHLKDFIFNTWHNSFLTFFFFFLFIYLLFSGVTYWISHKLNRQYKIGKEVTKKQLIQEIKLSLVSIFIFALQSIFIQQAYQKAWVKIDWSFSLIPFLFQVFLLFIWNEIHFYLSHWLLHRKWFFKNIHYMHHQSHTPTPFSIYSFHWGEAFLLGSVIFFPIFIYPFQYMALFFLPLLSILLNVLGHWDYDIVPGKPSSHWLRFSYRHSMHHKWVKGNYGFFMTFFDKIFNTRLNDIH